MLKHICEESLVEHMCEESLEFHGIIINSGGMHYLLQILQKLQNKVILKEAIVVVTFVCKNLKLEFYYEFVKEIIFWITNMVMKEDDQYFLFYGTEAIDNLFAGNTSHLNVLGKCINDSGYLSILINLLWFIFILVI